MKKYPVAAPHSSPLAGTPSDPTGSNKYPLLASTVPEGSVSPEIGSTSKELGSLGSTMFPEPPIIGIVIGAAPS